MKTKKKSYPDARSRNVVESAIDQSKFDKTTPWETVSNQQIHWDKVVSRISEPKGAGIETAPESLPAS